MRFTNKTLQIPVMAVVMLGWSTTAATAQSISVDESADLNTPVNVSERQDAAAREDERTFFLSKGWGEVIVAGTDLCSALASNQDEDPAVTAENNTNELSFGDRVRLTCNPDFDHEEHLSRLEAIMEARPNPENLSLTTNEATQTYMGTDDSGDSDINIDWLQYYFDFPADEAAQDNVAASDGIWGGVEPISSPFFGDAADAAPVCDE